MKSPFSLKTPASAHSSEKNSSPTHRYDRQKGNMRMQSNGRKKTTTNASCSFWEHFEKERGGVKDKNGMPFLVHLGRDFSNSAFRKRQPSSPKEYRSWHPHKLCLKPCVNRKKNENAGKVSASALEVTFYVKKKVAPPKNGGFDAGVDRVFSCWVNFNIMFPIWRRP